MDRVRTLGWCKGFLMSLIVAARFAQAYELLSRLGWCDSPGGMEYERYVVGPEGSR